MRNNRTVTAQTRIDAFKSIYRELYAVCLLICSNENSAQAALLDVLLSKETHINRKKAFQLAVSSALKYPQEDAVLECLENVDRAPELANEQPWARRAVMLICACDLSFLQTAKIVGVKASEVRSAYARALACVRGSNEPLKRKELKNICRAELKRFGYAPDVTVLRRAVENRMASEAENSEMTSGGRLLLSNVMAIIMLLLIGFVLWTGMVMLNYFRDTAQNSAQTQTTTLEEEDASLFGTD